MVFLETSPRVSRTTPWWVKDNAGHGGPAFKMYREQAKGLEWQHDADERGDFIEGNHKGETGKFIPWSQLHSWTAAVHPAPVGVDAAIKYPRSRPATGSALYKRITIESWTISQIGESVRE